MEARKFNEYLKAIPVIEAQKMMDEITVSVFPHMKQHRRSEIHKKLTQISKMVKKEFSVMAKFGDVKNSILEAIKRGR